MTVRSSLARTRRASALLVSVLVGLGPTLHTVSAIAQTPTPDQLKAFQSLPSDQRDAIMQQLGGRAAGGSSGGAAANTGNSNTIVVDRPDVPNGIPGAAGMKGQIETVRRIHGFEQLIIDLAVPPMDSGDLGREPKRPPDPKEQALASERRDQILRRNPYELTGDGVLQILGFEPMPLAGLTEREVQLRLASHPLLRDFNVSVTVLRVDAQGSRALKPFGYDMFLGGATAFVPGTDIPAPADYQLGAGDVLSVQLYGKTSQTYSLPIARDGMVSFPEIGPIAVGGLGYGAAQSMLQKRVSEQMIGTQARVTLSDLRSQRVLVLGDAQKPGSYVVSSLSTVTNALFASGGVKPIGSLRNIEVKRDGKLLRSLDLYEVLLKGNTANDLRLQTGDVVFIPPVGTTVGIDGEIRRPAIYELTREKTLGDLVSIAGGLKPEADASAATVERVGHNGERSAVSLDLSTPAGRGFALRSGDLVRIGAASPVIDNGIELSGHVYRPGTYAWRKGLRLSDVLRSVDELKPNADLRYILVRREASGNRHVSVFSADLAAALAARGGTADIPLSARDRITVFDDVSPRERVVKPLLEEVRRQSQPEDLAGIVSVDGLVNAPGTYPLEPNMRISDLLRAGGGLKDAAYLASAELTRYSVVNGERRQSQVVAVDLQALRSGNASADTALTPYDLLTVRSTPEWDEAASIELLGEFRFPGVYPIRRGETLREVIARAGGLTSLAFPEAAVLTREELKSRERDQIERLATRLQADITSMSLQAAKAGAATTQSPAQTLAAGQGLLDQLRKTKPVGRLVIDLKGMVAGSVAAGADLEARNGDKLIVPRSVAEVSVVGEVQNATSHLYRPGLTRNTVISLSGGLTNNADKGRIYVVRADGSVIAGKSGFFSHQDTDVHAGDTIVVPTDTEHIPALPMWTAVTTIIYNLAVAATAIRRF